MELPKFKYHPDPIATGSIKVSDKVCDCCGKVRGYVYYNPVYEGEEERTICPWCIADGSAHRKYNTEFTDAAGIGGGGWDEVPDEIVEEVAYRTPAFSGWQEERWWSHCGDAAEFIGFAGEEEAKKLGNDYIDSLRQDFLECGREEDWPEYFKSLYIEGNQLGYIFRCRHCGKYGGYSDSN